MDAKIFSDDYAIVFAGGGAKGAWQVGVWKALQRKFAKPAVAVAGTSVGALNAALYALSPTDTSNAEKIWKDSIRKKPIITPQLPAQFVNLAAAVESASSFLADLLIQCKKITFFSNKNLESIIQEGITGRKFCIPTYVCAYDQKNQCPHYESIEIIEDEEIRRKWLLASTAIPYIFKGININNIVYTDGGFGWDHALRIGTKSLRGMRNVPLEPIKQHGNVKTVFILTLSQNEETFWQEANTNFHIIPIMPSKDLGNALDFSDNHIKSIMELGEKDGMAWLESGTKLIENSTRFTQIRKSRKMIDAFKHKFDEIKKIRQRLLKEYKSEFEETLQKYKSNPTAANREKLENCSLLQFSSDSFTEMGERIYADVFGGFDVLKNFEETMNDNDFENEFSFCVENGIKLISIAESYGKHVLSQQVKDVLSHAQNKKIASELPTEKKELLKSIVNEFRSIYAIFCDQEQELACFKLDTLKEKIQELLEKFENEVASAKRAIPAEAPLPQLPSVLKPSRCLNFIGRKYELDELHSAIQKNPDKAIVLFGLPGNGKKQLTMKYATMHQKEFPGGCFIIDAVGKKSFSEALRSLLDSSEICKFWGLRRDDIPDTEDARTNLVVNKLKDDPRKKLLIVSHIDDPLLLLKAGDFDLYSAANITLIATAGQRLLRSPDDIIQIGINRLTTTDGMTLLKKRCPTIIDEKIISKIVEDCAGNPWALNIIGARYFDAIACYGEYGEAEFLEQEYTSGEIKNEVLDEFCFKIVKPSYDILSDEGKTLLIYASLLSYGKICGKWLKGLFDKTWGKSISELIRRSLLDDISSTEDKKNKIYWFEMPENTRKAILRFVEPDELKKCAEKLCNHISEYEMKSHSFSWDETSSLAECFCAWADESWRSWNQKILPMLFSLDMHDDLGDYLSEYKMFDLRQKVCDAAERVIQTMENGELKWKNQASCFIYRGHINLDCNQAEQALRCYQQSYEIRQKIFGEANETYLPQEYQGTVYGHMGKLDEAEKIFRICENKFKCFLKNAALPDRRTAWETLARLYKRWADAQFQNGKSEEAEVNYKKAIDCAQQGELAEKDIPGGVAAILLGRFLRAIGIFYKKQDCRDDAIRYLQQSNDVLRQRKAKEDHPDVIENLKDLSELGIGASGSANTIQDGI